MNENHLIGLDSVAAATTLLRRMRKAHPTRGLYEAADLQWWWRSPRSTDVSPQLFWFDGDGNPEAAFIATDWGAWTSLTPLVMPDADAGWVAEVVARGLTHAGTLGIETAEFEVDQGDAALHDSLTGHGFAKREDGLVETWMSAEARPEVSPLRPGYRLADRSERADDPHHMIGRNGPAVEERLRQTSLYRPDLDLCILDDHDTVAADTLCWFDPETATGLVEPMGTEADHRRQGLARHLLTRGVELLVEAGAERVKICFEVDNEAARNLYLGVGFEPVKQTDIYAGPVGTGP